MAELSSWRNKPNSAPSVIVTKEQHQSYTNTARAKYAYGKTDYANLDSGSVKNFFMGMYAGRDDDIDLVESMFE